MEISWDDFEKIDFRVGRIIEVKDFPEARNPSYRLVVNLGAEIGIKKSCAQLTNYSKEELLGKQVTCVVNFPAKQIATAVSEVLVTGVQSAGVGISLLVPDFEVPLGERVF